MNIYQPVVWVLSGNKVGDTSQMLALADALGWEYTVKQLVYRSTELFTSLLLKPSLTGIYTDQSSILSAPWPDLVITAGRRNEPVARWISRQSGYHTKIVHLGRPWAPLGSYDLIITTPQYFLPDQKNILHIPLPLHNVNKTMLREWRSEWEAKLPDLPRPWWVVLLGGDSGPFVFTREKARILGKWVNTQASQHDGSVFITNSARTPDHAYSAFLAELSDPFFNYQWISEAADNPYQGLLSNADHLVVTGESMSMLAEASVTDVPLYIFDLADCPAEMPLVQQPCPPWWRLLHNYQYKPLTHRLAMTLIPLRMRRDVSRIQSKLIESKRAAWAGQKSKGEIVSVENSMDIAVQSVKGLFDN